MSLLLLLLLLLLLCLPVCLHSFDGFSSDHFFFDFADVDLLELVILSVLYYVVFLSKMFLFLYYAYKACADRYIEM